MKKTLTRSCWVIIVGILILAIELNINADEFEQPEFTPEEKQQIEEEAERLKKLREEMLKKGLEKRQKEKEEKLRKWGKGIEVAIKKVERKYGGRIRLAAKKHEMDPNLPKALIVLESLGENNAVSKAKAKGLTQLMDGTAKDMGIKDSFHPYENIWAGTKYLKMLIKRFQGLETALVAYNRGPNQPELLEDDFSPDNYLYVQKYKLVLSKL